VEQQSKQAKESKRKKEAEPGGNGDGSANGFSDFPPELVTPANAALEAEKQSVEKGIDAWKKIVASAPGAWAPRRELARVYRKAERWNAFIEVMKDAVDKASWGNPEDKVPILMEMIEVYRRVLARFPGACLRETWPSACRCARCAPPRGSPTGPPPRA